MVNVVIKTIDEEKKLPLPAVDVNLSTQASSYNGVSDAEGFVTFRIPAGGGEAGRWPEPGVEIKIIANKAGYRPPPQFTEMLFRDMSIILGFVKIR